MSNPIGTDDDIGGSGAYGNEPAFVAQLGRIGGKLLASNLVRSGAPLSFSDTASSPIPILHLDTANKRIGINRSDPQTALHLSAPLEHGDLEVTNLATFDEVTFGYGVVDSIPNYTTISTVTGNLTIQINDATNPTINYQAIRTSEIIFNDNSIRGFKTNSSIRLNPNGTGITLLNNNTSILGNLTVNGNMLMPGNLSTQGTIYIGNNPLDVVVINPDFGQTLLPSSDNQYDLGSNISHNPSALETLRWNNLYIPSNDNLQNINTPLPEYINLGGTMAIGNPNFITPLTSNTNLVINPDSGRTIIENFTVEDGFITNNVINGPTTIVHTGAGYLKFDGTLGVRIPAGTNIQREFIAKGEIRWNTDSELLEVYNGQEYTLSTGSSLITQDLLDDIANLYAIILG